MFGFIQRNCSKFNNPITFQCLYTLPHIYIYIICNTRQLWDSHIIGQSNLIEGVQITLLDIHLF